jgi:hypothetical protein
VAPTERLIDWIQWRRARIEEIKAGPDDSVPAELVDAWRISKYYDLCLAEMSAIGGPFRETKRLIDELGAMRRGTMGACP